MQSRNFQNDWRIMTFWDGQRVDRKSTDSALALIEIQSLLHDIGRNRYCIMLLRYVLINVYEESLVYIPTNKYGRVLQKQ
jgi:hypothetical protein